MAIEELYPYAIMLYSGFVTILAVYLWKLTNLNVDGTRHNIEKQVATAVTDIQTRLDAKLDEFEMPDLDGETLMARLDKLETDLPDAIGNHVAMHYKSIQATEAKTINKALEDMGINFDAAAGEAMEMAEARLPPEMIAMKKLLTAKIPKGMKENNPTWAWIIEQARQAGGGLIMSRLQERAGIGGIAVESVNSGFGVR